MERKLLVERLSRAMRPAIFNSQADDEVGPATRYERGQTRLYAQQVLDSQYVVDADRVKAALALRDEHTSRLRGTKDEDSCVCLGCRMAHALRNGETDG